MRTQLVYSCKYQKQTLAYSKKYLLDGINADPRFRLTHCRPKRGRSFRPAPGSTEASTTGHPYFVYATYHLYYSTGTRLLVGAQVLRCDCVATLVRSLFLFNPACALGRLEALAVDYGAKKWSERE